MTNDLPLDVWGEILRLVRGEKPGAGFHRQLFRYLTVNKSWANIILPLLYHDIHMEIDLMTGTPRVLEKLSSSLLSLPQAEEVGAGIKHVRVEFTETSYERDEARSATILNISNWLTVVIAHAPNLATFSLTGGGVGTQAGAITALAVPSRDSLTGLAVTITSLNVETLHVIARMSRLQSLGLHFYQCLMDSAPRFSTESLLGIPPLLMPNIQHFHFSWEDETIPRIETEPLPILEYISECRFHHTSTLDLASTSEIDPHGFETLNLLYLRHHSKRVRLRMRGDIFSPAILRHSESVVFDHQVPVELFDGLDRLPPLLILHMANENHTPYIRQIAEILVQNPCADYRSCIQISCLGHWTGYFNSRPQTNFAWDMAKEHPGSTLEDLDLSAVAHMRSCAQLLATKGITLADSHGLTGDGHRVAPARLIRPNATYTSYEVI